MLSHSEGIVDEKYIDRSGDDTYKIGQRIVISIDDVRSLANLIEQLANGIRGIFV